MSEVHLVAGTRPEAIKLAPMVNALRDEGLNPVLIASGQHPTMVHQALDAFGLRPDETLHIDRSGGGQPELSAGLMSALDSLWSRRVPDVVVTQGDTTTTLVASLVAFWAKVPVVHLEAGLRSHDLSAPFPEEGNRKMIGQIASLHLPPTRVARSNLERDGIPMDRVVVTGNTVVDAVLEIDSRNGPVTEPELPGYLDRARAGSTRLILVTVHRRESWGAPLDRVLAAVRSIITARPDVEVVLPTHPNPAVRAQVVAALEGVPRVLITEPLPYPELVSVLAASTLVLSDSGGIQEEAPSFGVPVLVLREVTERMEAVDAGCALMLGTDRDDIISTALRLLDDPGERARMTAVGNPFGDGKAAVRGAEAIAWMLGKRVSPPSEFEYGFPSLRPVEMESPDRN